MHPFITFPTKDGAVKLLVRKNRNGPTGFLPLRFRKETASFESEGN